jgi:hypothetical protein
MPVRCEICLVLRPCRSKPSSFTSSACRRAARRKPAPRWTLNQSCSSAARHRASIRTKCWSSPSKASSTAWPRQSSSMRSRSAPATAGTIKQEVKPKARARSMAAASAAVPIWICRPVPGAVWVRANRTQGWPVTASSSKCCSAKAGSQAKSVMRDSSGPCSGIKTVYRLAVAPMARVAWKSRSRQSAACLAERMPSMAHSALITRSWVKTGNRVGI